VAVRFAMPKVGSMRLVPVGIGFMAAGSVALFTLMRLLDPSFLTLMGPIAFYSFGIAFVLPAIGTASLAPFPHMAGAASAMGGFMQMGAGLVGSMVAVAIGDPVLAVATVIPGMGAIAVTAWAFWRRMPAPPSPALPAPPPLQPELPS
jgi:DHA1 family bicyclomycin/chloramphenicol resistance-like MFS transporter